MAKRWNWYNNVIPCSLPELDSASKSGPSPVKKARISGSVLDSQVSECVLNLDANDIPQCKSPYSKWNDNLQNTLKLYGKSNIITISDSDSDWQSLPDIDESVNSDCLFLPLKSSPLLYTRVSENNYIDSISSVENPGENGVILNHSEELRHQNCESAQNQMAPLEHLNNTTHDHIPFQDSCSSISEIKGETENYGFIYISDESDLDLDDVQSMTDDYTENLVLNHESFNYFLSNDLILPYLFQSPSSAVIDSGKDLPLQPSLTLKLIDSYLEEGEELVFSTANIAALYLYSFQPNSRLIQDLFKLLIYNKADISLENKSFVNLYCLEISSLLNVIFHRYPENLTVIWRSVMKLIYCVGKQDIRLYNFSLAIELCLSVFESEFIQSKSFNLNQLKQCQSYRVLANEESYINIKQIVTWLKYVFNSLIDKDSILVHTLVHKLQKLLDISINISCKSTTMAKRIAKELVSVYVSIPYLAYRLMLNTTIKSDLLRFKVMETILEQFCDKTRLDWSQMPMSLSCIAESFFEALPPTNYLLDDDLLILSQNIKVSPSRCEELVMLLYYVVISYILCLQGSFHKPLSHHLTTAIEERSSVQTTEPYETAVGCPPWGSLHIQLDGLSKHILQLKEHLNQISPELSRQTQLYIMMMDHLTDLVADDIVLSVF